MRRSVFRHGSVLLVELALVTACASSQPKGVTAPPSAPAARLTCGEIGVFVQLFAAPSTSDSGATTRSCEVVTFHRASVAAAVGCHAGHVGALGITPSADPIQVVMAVEHAPRTDL